MGAAAGATGRQQPSTPAAATAAASAACGALCGATHVCLLIKILNENATGKMEIEIYCKCGKVG